MSISVRIVLYYCLGVNAFSFVLYGLDKWKSKRSKWRIPEATLLWIAVLGGSVGALLGIHIWHHKTLHPRFKYGVPAILIVQVLLLLSAFVYCHGW